MSLPSFQAAVVVEKVGGPEVLEHRTDYPVPTPGEGQVLVKNTVSGINFIDTYFRTGLYPSSKPEVLGREAAGAIVALGPNTDKYQLKVGDRVVWLGPSAYAEYTAVSAAKAINIPHGLSEEIAAASFMSGLTAITLTQETYEVQKDDWVLLHAAAGGVGILLAQVLKYLGANIIATTGGKEKVALVKRLGIDHAIDYRSEEGKDWVKLVKEITNGNGVDVVFDSVGKDTWEGGLEVIKRKGTIVWFGNSSGPVPPLPLPRLSAKCIKIARPSLLGYIETREELEYYCNQLFRLLTSEKVKVQIHNIYPLTKVRQAHQDLEGRKTTGKLLLNVST
ncbi:quinone oxidoreductase family protein [Aspergillus puulaauensis]|uniref:Probable quinone oxidoreductase n=1 Tax=Aspergillus puulaauensis TaxID=1220207 RepID=A0A7R8AQ42_9EURO|nr:NADPH:quinone reductase [Aspergillus puulaauensis]BCS25478.1 NADPH:quinone reductase [Aspergillus puulaauensis]